jgi:hypothetical protein
MGARISAGGKFTGADAGFLKMDATMVDPTLHGEHSS